MALTIDALADFLVTRMGVDADVGPSTPLFSSGRLDSFSLVELIMFIEERAGERMSPADVNLDNLDSMERIVAYAARASGR